MVLCVVLLQLILSCALWDVLVFVVCDVLMVGVVRCVWFVVWRCVLCAVRGLLLNVVCFFFVGVAVVVWLLMFGLVAVVC